MTFGSKNILFISPEPWEHLFVSKHHYATHLAERGNKVFFLGPPEKVYYLQETQYSNLWCVGYKGFLKGIRFLPAFVQRWLIKKEFEELQRLTNTTFDIVWSFDNSVFFDFKAFPKGIFCISHIVDWNQNFQFAKASSTAHLCLASTQFILNRQLKYNQNSYFIHHGYAEYLEMANSVLYLPGKSKIKVMYAGNLNIMYIDWDLLFNLVAKYSDLDFCFAGGGENGSNFQQLLKSPNVYYLGKLDKADLNSLLKESDILILTYRNNEFPEQLANPHKMMEYLASGKMVVSSWTEEYNILHKEEIILMAKTPEEFVSSFEKCLTNIVEYNSDKHRESRISFAKNNSYYKQIEKIEKLISKV